ncbi:MAG: glycogen synthase [Lentisphaerae bacterium GWF2_52_8]|nr:MAG: glycogen synthase [Lentisphaerae bacterium GWF2_52_8]
MNIVWVSSEAHPFAKTGGLADVSHALPRALAARGHNVSVIMPYYPQIMNRLHLKFTGEYDLLGVPFGEKTEWAKIRELKMGERWTFYFIEFNRFYDRPALYDWFGNEYSDNGQRFIFLSRAAMQAVLALGLHPDIIHCNDWHTALCSVYLNSSLYWDYPHFKNCRSVLTIHNIGYQGVYHKSNLLWTGLGWEFFNYHCLEFHDQIGLLKAGIMTSHMVNTVSPTYAEEILSQEYGFNLDSSLRNRAAQGRLRGIINGIDDAEWNPASDHYLPAHYHRDNLGGKAVCKAALQAELKLEQNPNKPLFGVVSRFAHQKGIDVLVESLEDLLINDDYQFAILGAGDPWLHSRFDRLAALYPGKFGLFIGYNDRLAHLIEAGSDFFVMPSRYEPCGLNQMYSMRYGTAPVVRSTGGLADTVINYDRVRPWESTGFRFWDLYPKALSGTMRWAASVYQNDKDGFYKMQYNGMSRDFSWNHTASEYEKLYEDAHK